uniref:alcohol dehydrogenase (NADP(+)) n=1 Tax=Desulfobacca acetoxidans TaxID=60893 RepID=A0A7C3ZCK4_9BACT
MFTGYAATEPGGPLKPLAYDPGPLGDHEVEIKVEYCGLCHSDLSMLDNEWGLSQYPLIPGHEIIGTVAGLGAQVKGLAMEQRVGVGWNARSCLACEWCLSGNHHLCASVVGTIVGRHGGFADRVRAEAAWVIPLPEELDPQTAAPLMCGGITVFSPLLLGQVKPTARVGVVGIGGLGHMALMFARAWGCEVTAFSSNPEKEAEARKLGAHHFINSQDLEALKKAANSLDFILSTVNVPLNWEAYIAALRPQGRLHLVGVVLQPLSFPLFPLLSGQKSLSASPTGSPAAIAAMLNFAARHQIRPVVETYPLSEVNEALEKLRRGTARYRIVLKP